MEPSSYSSDDLFAAIEAYSAAMGDSYGHERVGRDTADEILEAIGYDSDDGGRSGVARSTGKRRGDDLDAYPTGNEEDYDFPDDDYDTELSVDDDPFPIPPLAAAPFHVKMSLPTPTVMNPGALMVRLVRELAFPEHSAFMSILDKSNANLFSCMPKNGHLYENVKLLSQRPEDVMKAAEDYDINKPRMYATAVDLNAHGSMELPTVPNSVDELPKYVDDVQKFFLSELEAREAAYAKLFFGYCASLALYIGRVAKHESRGLRVTDRAADIRKRTRKLILEMYYREAARLAKTLFLHLYLSVCRETARRLAATQHPKRDLFVFLKYEWTGERQFWCLFQPIMENHGVSLVDGAPLTDKQLQNLNHTRVELGLLPVRCGLLETPGEKIASPATFNSMEPRSSWYLSQKIIEKLMCYADKHASKDPAASAKADHPYSKRIDAPNYGSTLESMLDYPNPERELPCDPYVPPCVTVAQ